jgi:MATE family multidrug resistance protein
MRRAVLGTYGLATGFMAVCALIFVLLPRDLIALYTHDPAIIDIGAGLLLMAAAFQVFDGAQVAGGAVLRGAADTHVPMAIAAVGYWVIGVPIGYTLAFRAGAGPIGVWGGLTVGLGVAAALLVLRVRRILWRTPPELLHAGL